MKPSIKVGLIVAAAGAALGGAYWGFGEFQLQNFNPQPIKPDEVALVAVNTDLGFSIRVANSVAQLVQVEGQQQGFQAPDSNEQGSDARRIPMRELLESLQGNEESLVRLVAVLNKIDLDELQPGMTTWSEADLRKALSGDMALEKKLTEDLNIQLDGTPLSEIRLKSILNGIQVLCEVPVKVSIEGTPQTLIAKLPLSYQPTLAKEVSNIIEKKFEPSTAEITGHYQEIAFKITKGNQPKENVRAALESLISESKKSGLARRPEQVLQGAVVLVNKSMVESATTSQRKDEKGNPIYTVHLNMTEDGRKRLWKYSRNQKGSNLLVVVNGIAIAAPKITTELAGRQLDLTDLREKRLVEDAVKTINELKKTN